MLSVDAQTLFCNFLCAGSSLPSSDADDSCQWKSSLLSDGFCIGARHRRRVAKGGLHLWGEVNVVHHRVK
jgi:hypothetical protein